MWQVSTAAWNVDTAELALTVSASVVVSVLHVPVTVLYVPLTVLYVVLTVLYVSGVDGRMEPGHERAGPDRQEPRRHLCGRGDHGTPRNVLWLPRRARI